MDITKNQVSCEYPQSCRPT